MRYGILIAFIAILFGCDATELETELDVTYDVTINNNSSVIVGDTIDIILNYNNPLNIELETDIYLEQGSGKVLFEGKEVINVISREKVKLQYVSNKDESVKLCVTVRDGYDDDNDKSKNVCTTFNVYYSNLDLQYTLPRDTVYLEEEMKFILNYVNPNNSISYIKYELVSVPLGSNFALYEGEEKYFNIDYELTEGLHTYKMIGDLPGWYKIKYETDIEGYENKVGYVEVYMRNEIRNQPKLLKFDLAFNEKFENDTVSVIYDVSNKENITDLSISYDGVGELLYDDVVLAKGVYHDINIATSLKFIFPESDGDLEYDLRINSISNEGSIDIKVKEQLPYIKECSVVLRENIYKKVIVSINEIEYEDRAESVLLRLNGIEYSYKYENNSVYQILVDDDVKVGDGFEIRLINYNNVRGEIYTGEIE